MKKLLLFFTIVLCSTFGFSQENWGYLPIEVSSNYHGAICPIDENVVHVVSDYGTFYKTEDGGENWTEFDSGVNVYFLDMAFDGPNNGYAVGAEGKIMKTSNAGQSWDELTSGTSEALISIAVNATNSIWAVGDNGTVLHSTNGGNTWVLNNTLTSERLNSIKFKDGNIGYIAGDNGVLFYTENGGIDWEQLTVPATNDLFSISITENDVYLLNGSSGNEYYFYEANQVFKTNNNLDWTQFYIEDPIGGLGSSSIYFLNDGVGFSIGSVAMLCDCCNVWIVKTNDGCENWDFSLNEETNSANCHANEGYADIKFATEDVGYALLGRFVLKTPYETAGVADFNLENAFTVYPNPTVNGEFNIKINSQNITGLSMEIVNINGKEVFTENNLKEDNNFSIANYSEGIYFVKILKNGKMLTAKKLLKR